MLKDIFPQNAVDLGMIKTTGIKSLLYKYFRRKEKGLYFISDRIGCMSQANVDYVGSITIDSELLAAANIIRGEKVQVVNVTNGERLETYAIPGEAGSGVVCLNGAAAHKASVGDVVIIISYAALDFEEAKSFQPWVIFPETATNKLVK
jgi:aspartate 1-decarboxylase